MCHKHRSKCESGEEESNTTVRLQFLMIQGYTEGTNETFTIN